MATLLLVIIYSLFITLAIPQSALGAVWQPIVKEFGFADGNLSIITFVLSGATVIASTFSAKLCKKFGIGKVVVAVTVFTAITLVGFALSNSLILFIILGFLSGLGSGAIDAPTNNFIASNYKPGVINFVHCFYGVGAFSCPLLISFALTATGKWQIAYIIMAGIFVFISIGTIIALPLWKKVEKLPKEDKEVFETRLLPFKKMAKVPSIWAVWIIFLVITGVEATIRSWGSSYLVKEYGFSHAIADNYFALFYIGMTACRLLCGFIVKLVKQMHLIYVGLSITALSVIAFMLPLSGEVKGMAFLLIGFGIGPIFPNLTYLTPANFGKDVSPSIVAIQATCCNVGIMLFSPLFGIIVEILGYAIFPYYVALLLLIVIICVIFYDKAPKRPSWL